MVGVVVDNRDLAIISDHLHAALEPGEAVETGANLCAGSAQVACDRGGRERVLHVVFSRNVQLHLRDQAMSTTNLERIVPAPLAQLGRLPGRAGRKSKGLAGGSTIRDGPRSGGAFLPDKQ